MVDSFQVYEARMFKMIKRKCVAIATAHYNTYTKKKTKKKQTKKQTNSVCIGTRWCAVNTFIIRVHIISSFLLAKTDSL